MNGQSRFSRMARGAARVAGQPASFLLAVAIVVVWAITGPMFHFSDTWQLVINTGTTVVTFLMVFLIQNSQNRDTIAIQVKLDELVRAVKAAENSVLDLEEFDEQELEVILKKYQRIAREARSKQSLSTGSAEPRKPAG
ncbi:MAG TPA: low affinity iron permease family protein [Planctomycetaceae bacterium]|nr:low affinity iron permease family protein [Planctomycetaceae bacterium]